MMGTRADFYVGTGEDAEWIGSVAWDGYQWGERIESGDSDDLIKAKTESEYRKEVAQLLESREDGTTPEMGWPWPWDDSCTTDCAYCFIDGELKAFSWGCTWGDDGIKQDWPDMSKFEHSAKAGSPRSGVMVMGV